MESCTSRAKAMSRGRVFEFINRNIVAFVMVPSIVVIHWGWIKLQDIEVLVPKDSKKELPIITGAKYLEEKVKEKFLSSDSSSGPDSQE